jgi:biopolymer transport protein ExbD
MAGVNVEGKRGGRRAVDSELNMVPMIDLLMVTISFLLLTAVWVHMSRLEGHARSPGNDVETPCEGAACAPEARLHVETKDPTKFVLVWKQGINVIRTVDVARNATRTGKNDAIAFPDLAVHVAGEWRAAGRHRDATDRAFDHAVVHAANDMPYRELIGVMDAVAQPKRPLADGTKLSHPSAFQITFATD